VIANAVLYPGRSDRWSDVRAVLCRMGGNATVWSICRLRHGQRGYNKRCVTHINFQWFNIGCYYTVLTVSSIGWHSKGLCLVEVCRFSKSDIALCLHQTSWLLSISLVTSHIPLLHLKHLHSDMVDLRRSCTVAYSISKSQLQNIRSTTR
jgi:hypothetical protein